MADYNRNKNIVSALVQRIKESLGWVRKIPINITDGIFDQISEVLHQEDILAK